MKSVFITGVLGGIGQALAERFNAEGYYVYGTDIKEKKHDFCHTFFQFDLDTYVMDFAYRHKWQKKLLTEVRQIDVLINNAAVQRLDSFSNIDLGDWMESLNVNLTGPMLLCNLFLDKLESSKGCIINIGSIHQQLTKPKFVSYATSKSGLIGFTKALAVDLEGKIRVNAISPAAIQTKMLLEGFNGNEKALIKLKKMHPVQRIGYPNEVARLALFLASENNGFIHGANFTLDGGISSVLKDL